MDASHGDILPVGGDVDHGRVVLARRDVALVNDWCHRFSLCVFLNPAFDQANEAIRQNRSVARSVVVRIHVDYFHAFF